MLGIKENIITMDANLLSFSTFKRLGIISTSLFILAAS